MYVRKFEAETLEEAIKAVKRDLGPDAIILKTSTNTGLKGALRKKVEITAAVKERDYANKVKVDDAIGESHQKDFYNSRAVDMSESISKYHSGSAYGKLGLNKVVQTVSQVTQKTTNMIKDELEDFLSVDESEIQEEKRPVNKVVYQAMDNIKTTEPVKNQASLRKQDELEGLIRHQKNKIHNLELKLESIISTLNKEDKQESLNSIPALDNLYTTLKTLDLNEKLIQRAIQKIKFNLSEDELKDDDLVYDQALSFISGQLNFSLPSFTKCDEGPTITVLISENAAGQSSMALKLSSIQKNNVVIKLRKNLIDKSKNDFTTKFLGIDVINVDSISHVISECRKQTDLGKSVVVDIKGTGKDTDETSRFVDSLNRSFANLEVITVISAMNTELYNRKIISKYQKIARGVIITYVDMCMNFGSLINLNYEFNDLSLMMLGTGPIVPDDIEEATSDRLMAGLLQL